MYIGVAYEHLSSFKTMKIFSVNILHQHFRGKREQYLRSRNSSAFAVLSPHTRKIGRSACSISPCFSTHIFHKFQSQSSLTNILFDRENNVFHQLVSLSYIFFLILLSPNITAFRTRPEDRLYCGFYQSLVP
jgi:hypothetical protein